MICGMEKYFKVKIKIAKFGGKYFKVFILGLMIKVGLA